MTDNTQSKLNGKVYILFGLSTAFLLAAPVIMLALFGLFLDNIFHTSPFIALFAATMGAIGGIMNVLKLIKTFNHPEFRNKINNLSANKKN